MDGWKSWKGSESWFFSAWYQRVRESYVAAWLFGVFQSSRTMSTSTSPSGGGVGGALSLMGCVREASPPPQTHYSHHHYHHHHHPPHQQQQQQHHRAFGLGEFSTVQHSIDPAPKEPKKRRFHPLRGLRKIFRRKSRGAPGSNSSDRDVELARLSREETTTRHPAGSPEEVRSRSASELLTDACDRESVFLRRGGAEDNFVKLRGGAGKLSVSHDSVFPGEVPHTRPLSSLASLTTLERRQARKSNEIIEHKEYNHHAAQRHRISLRVLEQIKTVIENRNQLASGTSPETASIAHTAGERYQQETTENRFTVFDKHGERNSEREEQAKITRSTKDTVDRTVLVAKEDLPQLESASLNHTAAHHRISVRPKNRRPPRRTVSTTTPSSDVGVSNSPSIPPTIAEDSVDSLEQQKQEQPQSTINNNNMSSTEPPPKTVGVIRKSSSRLSRNSDIFEELESKLSRKTSATSLSPDSLDVTTISQSSAEMATAVEEQQQLEVKWITRKPSNRISKGSDVFEELETKLPRRRSSSNRLSKSPDSLDSAPGCWFSKSTEEAFDKLGEYEEIAKPVTSARRSLLNPISKFTDRVSKSSDSLEAIEPLISDDSIERRRNSFDSRARKSSKIISKSSEDFDILEQNSCIEEDIGQELQKRSSASDINLSRNRRLSKSISKSSESFERIDMNDMKDDVDVEILLEDDGPKTGGRRSTKRMSSESSDNLDVEDRLENRRIRRTPKRMPSTSIVDMIVSGDDHERERRPTPTRKPSRLQKSSESSELGSTDTLDSERRNKSSESTETLDSLEKDLEQDRKDEEITDNVVDKREKNDSWSSRNAAVSDSDQASMGDDTEDSKSLISADNKYYWRQSSEPVSKENLGIQQLLAITIMTRMADNGNNQRGSVMYPKKRQQMSTSQPTSPVAKQEDTKILFDNLLVNSKNDEDLQNMLNGNISEVSTDTKSFKEKLIMFEKLGK
ncbi:microtubule-associated protein futsch isoform X2 [Camponotus floridanus]|uniref:microtubule-associated protein futsch isoform X2 n=1 Tax=Camponotus floridanus TaxID=104421 RepID=UPI000DC6BFA2|nr:microtubule-associated protein futsch isoform X2 [Camponotus floridanus]